jgi:hypothetical protein
MAEGYESRKIAGGGDVLKDCEALELELAELRVAYEQYFLGLEKRPPADRHAALKKRVQKQKGLFVRATAVKFRVQMIAQKFATYERMWLRTLQEMENGTYHRDVARARRKRAAQQQAPLPAKPAPATQPAADDFSIDEVAPQDSAPSAPPRPPPPAAMPRPAPAPARAGPVNGTGALTDDKLRAVYDAFLKAKKRCNEDVSRLSFEQVAQSLRKQVPELMARHQARSVEFKVVIKDGRAVLRAVPKEG